MSNRAGGAMAIRPRPFIGIWDCLGSMLPVPGVAARGERRGHSDSLSAGLDV